MNSQVSLISLDTQSDENLLNAKLRIENPEGEENLVKQIPDRSEVPQIIADYDVTPTGGRKIPGHEETYVWCAHCKSATHWNGYLARYDSDGVGILIGKDCGYKHYGVDFEKNRRVFVAKKNRQHYLVQLKKITPRLTDIIIEINELVECGVLKAFHDFRGNISAKSKQTGLTGQPSIAHFGELGSTFDDLVTSNNKWLCTVVFERDFEAEEKLREEKAKDLQPYLDMTTTEKKKYHTEYGRPDLKIENKFKKAIKNTAPLAGWELFDYSRSPRPKLVDCLEQLRLIFKDSSTKHTNGVATGQLIILVQTVAKIVRELCEVRNELSALSAFFSTKNLANVVECMNSMVNSEENPYSTHGKSLFFNDKYGRKHRITAQQVAMPKCSAILEMDGILNQ